MRSLLGRAVRRVLAGGRAAPQAHPPPPAAPMSSAPSPEPPPAPAEAELPLEVDEPVPGSLLLDCREPSEYAGGVAVGALLLPMDMVPHHLADLPRDRAITVYCAAGARSAGVAHWLREQGFAKAVSLAGGVGAVRFGGGEIRVPPGVRPGTRIRVPAETVVDGVVLGAEAEGEVIEQVGDTVVARIFDASGYQVRVRVRA